LTGRRIHVGICGSGWVATTRHIPSYRRLTGVEVISVYDRKEERASAVAQEHRIPRTFSSLEAFLASGLDIISICTPPWTHAEIAARAFEAGIHVFTEKPMAMDEGEARAMVEAAQRADRLLCVSHNFLFSRSALKADRLLKTLGPVQYVFGMQMSNPKRRLPTWFQDLPGGLLFDEAPHMLYTLQHFLGDLEVGDVRTTGRAQPHPPIVEVQFRGERGTGQVTMLLEAPLSEWHIALVGERGVVDLDLFRDITVGVRDDGRHRAGDILRTSATALSGHAMGFVTSGTRFVAKRQFWGHDGLIRRFVHAVSVSGPSPVEPERSVSVVRMMDQILAGLEQR
jgi:scyllo-inositol 2-dehydrogenase (NADP+)